MPQHNAFRKHFIPQLLKGKYYGESVRVAREITYTTYPSVNTWGAYQCYGDPYFTLDKSYTKKKRKTFTFVDKEEAKYMLGNVVSNIETGTSIKEEVIEETNAIIEAVNKYPLWKGDAKIMELVAIIYKELCDYKEAINRYRKLPGAEKASYSLRAVEQLFNLTTKQTYRDYNAGITAVTLANSSIIKRQAEIDNIKKQAIIEMEAYIHQFNQFNIAMTTERGSLLRSAYKNLAIITHPQFLARQMLASAKLPDGRDFRMPGIVPKLSETPGSTEWVGPALGAHTDAVLAGMGYTAEMITRLRQDGAV